MMERFHEYLPTEWKLNLNGWCDIDLTDTRTQLALLAAGLTTLYLIRQLTKKRYNLPPGPRPWPLVGNLLALRGESSAYERFVDMSHIYGDIFTFHFGPMRAVVLNSWDAIHQAYHDNAAACSNRPTIATIRTASLDGHSLTFSQYGPIWKVQRRILHTALRRFAKGNDFELLVSTRAGTTIDKMLEEEGQAFDPSQHLFFLVFNIMASMIFAESFEMDDPFFLKLSAEIDEATKLARAGNLADLYPILEYLPNRAVRAVNGLQNRFLGYLDDRLQEHKATFNPDDIRDFMDLILDAEQQILNDPSDDKTALNTMDKKHLTSLLKDAFFGGSDTTHFNLQWAIALCLEYPEMQARIQQEIDDIIGKDGVIKISRLPELRYLEAFIREVMRFRLLVPFSIPHTTSQDTTLGGYTIPKGTMLLSNIWAMHMDPKLWDAPETFNPDRWLDGKGALIPKPNHFTPFSVGRRSCPGRGVAEVEIPLVFALFLQKLRFVPATPGPFKAKRTKNPTSCVIEPFKVIALPR